MARKIIKEGLKAGVKKIGRGTRAGKAKIDPVKDLKAAKAKTGTKSTKTVKRSETPIQSERSKIAAANAAAKTRRAKAAGKTAGVSATRNTTNRVLPVGSKRAIGTSAAAIAGVSQLNKKDSSAQWLQQSIRLQDFLLLRENFDLSKTSGRARFSQTIDYENWYVLKLLGQGAVAKIFLVAHHY